MDEERMTKAAGVKRAMRFKRCPRCDRELGTRVLWTDGFSCPSCQARIRLGYRRFYVLTIFGFMLFPIPLVMLPGTYAVAVGALLAVLFVVAAVASLELREESADRASSVQLLFVASVPSAIVAVVALAVLYVAGLSWLFRGAYLTGGLLIAAGLLCVPVRIGLRMYMRLSLVVLLVILAGMALPRTIAGL
jgi:hypothetical protein